MRNLICAAVAMISLSACVMEPEPTLVGAKFVHVRTVGT